MAVRHGGTSTKITEEALEALRQKIGVERPAAHPRFTEVTRDALGHFAEAIGDTNPLWLDEAYAAKTRWGGLIAPPLFLISCGLVAPIGLPGIHAMFSGTDWEFYQPLRLGDRIIGTTKLIALEEKQSQFAGRMFQQIDETTFRNQRGEIVARLVFHNMRTERDTARDRGKYNAIAQHHYTEEELRAIEADYAREEIRGANPRCWEDTQIGDELTPVVKGPLTVTDNIAWVRAWNSPFIRAHGIAHAYLQRHPDAYIPNELGVPDVPERVHWDSEFARKVGVPAAYDYGPQRIAWLGHLMTNWMGDDGWLKTFSVQVRRFNLMGDTTWCRGRVTDKYIKDGAHLVECELWAINQRGEITAPGWATVALPSRRQGAE